MLCFPKSCVQAPSADNSQPWALNWDGEELAVSFSNRHKNHSIFSEGSHATLLAVGAVVEHLQRTLTANGIAGDWRWPSDPGLGNPYVSVLIKDTPADVVEPPGVVQRHTNRLAYHRTPIPASLVKETEQFREGANRVVPLVDKDQKSRFIRLIRTSSEARFCTRELHEWLFDSLRFTPEEVSRGDGLDVSSLSLPPGGRWFMRFISDWKRMQMLNRIGIYKVMALSEVALLSASPALMCIVGPADTRSVLDAGKLMTRLWIHLNLQGIAVHPYYVVTDQINRLREGKATPGFEAKIREVDEQTGQQLGLGKAEILHILFRVGFPRKTPVRSKRLPLDQVFVDNSPR